MHSMTIETVVTEDHLLQLPGELPINSRVRIVIETIDNSHAKPSEFQPRTPLGKQLLTLRQQHIASGGKLLTGDELDAEIKQRRGGINDD